MPFKVLASYTINGWSNNDVLLVLDDGRYTFYNCKTKKIHRPPFDTPRKVLEYIARTRKWDGGGDVNIQGAYIEWYYKGKEQSGANFTGWTHKTPRRL